MQAAFPIDVYHTDLERVVRTVFGTMLDLEVETASRAWQPVRDSVTAAIYFAGQWKGAVLVECNHRQASLFTSRLLSMEEPQEMNDDIRDALGEISNMLGGNLKSVLPPGVTLSMPSVVEGSDYSLCVCGGNAVERLAFSCTAGTFWVTLVEVLDAKRRPAASPSGS